ASKQSLDFGKLTRGQKLLKVISENAPTTTAVNWSIAGKSVAKVDGRSFVTGKHRYTSDVKLADMLFGKIVRPSALNASLVSVDAREAEALPGVKVIRDGNLIGVVAPDAHTAARSAGAIKAEWQAAPQPSAKELFDYLRKQASGAPQGNE